MGDGNIHWVAAMQKLPGMATFSARHEHCARAMAMGYQSATGKIGVASETCGPGFTQIMTALTTASRARSDGGVRRRSDGSFLMHIQELEMVARHRIKLLFCIFNDGAYGAEIHKLRADGVDDSASVFGYTDFAAIAKGFGLRGTNVTDVGQFKALFDAYQAQDKAEVWNIHVSDKVVAPSTRRGIAVGHGVR